MHFKRRRGQSIIETVVGIIFLIPIVLFLLDVAVLVLSNQANDNLAKNAARAAASATPGPGQPGTSAVARTAADNVVSRFGAGGTNPLITGARVSDFVFDSGAGQVSVTVDMDVRVPVPFPYFSTTTFKAKAVEPIVSIAPAP